MTTTQYKLLGTLFLVIGIVSTSLKGSKPIAGILIGIGFSCTAFQKIGLRKQ